MKLAANFSNNPPFMKLSAKRICFSSVSSSAAYSLVYTNSCRLNLSASLTSMKSSGFCTCFLLGAAVVVVVGAVEVVAVAIMIGGVSGRGGTIGVIGDIDGW